MTKSVIALDHIELTLGSGPSSVHVLKGISLNIKSGQSVGIVGPSGKSTLLMVLAGLEHVDYGSVQIAGEKLETMNEDANAAFRGNNIGIVFQSFHLIPNMPSCRRLSLPVGLLAERIFGEGARARAIATRCCSPPESSPG